MQGILIVQQAHRLDQLSMSVAKLRRHSGHPQAGPQRYAGPMATGVLPVFSGGASKAVDLQLNHTKSLPRCPPAGRSAPIPGM